MPDQTWRLTVLANRICRRPIERADAPVPRIHAQTASPDTRRDDSPVSEVAESPVEPGRACSQQEGRRGVHQAWWRGSQATREADRAPRGPQRQELDLRMVERVRLPRLPRPRRPLCQLLLF